MYALCNLRFGHEAHSLKQELSKFSFVIKTNILHVTEQSSLFIFQTLYARNFAWQLQTHGSFNNAKFNSHSPYIFCFELIIFTRSYQWMWRGYLALNHDSGLIKIWHIINGDVCDKLLICINEWVTVEYEWSINRLTCNGISK